MLLASGIGNGYLSNTSLSYLWSLGFGTVTAESIIPPTWQTSGSWGLLLTVLISNSPQLVLSFLYLTYNSLFTCMLLAAEWRGYAHERKALRVSSASGKQRSTYWLQLPYRYSIPLLVASGTLHWLVSQSIFLARVTVLDSSGVEDPAESLSTCGYSNIAIFFVIALGVPVVLIGIAHGFRRYDGGMPLAGSCSTAINAACHPPKDDVHASGKKVMWGVVDGCIPSDGGIAIGHCSFSSFEVSAPVEGQIYAGSRGRHELGCRASQAQIINDNGHVAISESLSVQLVTHPATTHTHQVRE